MRKILVLGLAMLIPSFLLGQENKYHDSENNYTINYYKDWVLKDDKEGLNIFAPLDGPNDKHGELLAVNVFDAQGMTLSELYETYITNNTFNSMSEFTILGEGKATVNKLDSKWIECQYKDRGTLLTNIIYLTVQGQKTYMLMGVSSSKEYPRYKDRFLKMINTFRLL